MKQFLHIGTPSASQAWDWLKARTKGMLKFYFITTFISIIMTIISKHAVIETEYLIALVIISIKWGYTISITFWLLIQDAISRRLAMGFHFVLWLFTYCSGGITIWGLFPPGSILNFFIIDYWILLGIQNAIARKVEASEINASLRELKVRWANETATQRFNGFGG